MEVAFLYLHDNVLSNFECGGGETHVGRKQPRRQNMIVWNNVIYNLNGAQTPNAGENASGMTVYYWNNTVVPPSGNNCLVVASGENLQRMTVLWTEQPLHHNRIERN